MVYIARVLLSGRQKIAAALLLFLSVAFLAYYPRVTEALLAFCLGGEVPGTNIVLSPNMILALVALLFGITIITIFIRMYLKAARGNRNFVQIPVKAVETVAISVIEAVEVAPAVANEPDVSPAFRKRSRLGIVLLQSLRRVARLLGAVGTALWSAAFWLARRTALAARFIAELLFTIVVLVWNGLGIILRGARQGAKREIKLIAALLSRFWRWLKPHLRSFDAWLEVQFRKLETKLKQRLNRNDNIRSVAAMGREYRKSVGGLAPKSVLRQARVKAGHIRTRTKIVATSEARD